MRGLRDSTPEHGLRGSVATLLLASWLAAGCSGSAPAPGELNGAVTTYSVRTRVLGTGSGKISWPNGTCNSLCFPSFAGSVVLTAAPASGSQFSGWLGACAGTGPNCTLPVNGATSVAAVFSTSATPPLVVTTIGRGRVTGQDSLGTTVIDCGSACAAEVADTVTLTATPDPGQAFLGWTGACAGGASTCVVSAGSAALEATATFTGRVFTLSTSTTGSGKGTLTSSPAGINCGAGSGPSGSCNAGFNPGAIVTLTATPLAGSDVLTAWTGACATIDPAHPERCVVTLDASLPVSARFDAVSPGTPGSAASQMSAGPSRLAIGTVSTITVVALDAAYHPLAGKIVTLAASPSAGVTIVQPLMPTDSSGIARGTVTSSSTGPKVITATVAGTPIAQTATVTFTGFGTIAGVVGDRVNPPNPVAGATVSVEGQAVSTTTAADGSFSLSGAAVGPAFLTVTPPDPTVLLPTTLRTALIVPEGGTVQAGSFIAKVGTIATTSGSTTVSGAGTRFLTDVSPGDVLAIPAPGDGRAVPYLLGTVNAVNGDASLDLVAPAAATISSSQAQTYGLFGPIFLSARPSDQAAYAGSASCIGCHRFATPSIASAFQNSAHWRSLINTDGSVNNNAAAMAKLVNPVFASGPRSGKHLWPENNTTDYVDTGIKATSPNYDPNDPCIYGPSPSGNCAAGGTSQYPNGQVEVLLCSSCKVAATTCTTGSECCTGVCSGSPRRCTSGATSNPVYTMKFGGSATSCADGAFYDPTKTCTGPANCSAVPNTSCGKMNGAATGTCTPNAPLAHVDAIYGGDGDVAWKNATSPQLGIMPRPGMGVFRQQYLARLADVKASTLSTFGPAYDSPAHAGRDLLVLPVQIVQSGDLVNGGPKLSPYHATEQMYPGESWTQRTRTYSHACAGCHTGGISIEWKPQTIALAVPRPGNVTSMSIAAVTAFDYPNSGASPSELNIGCEQCHGPGSEHAGAGGGTGTSIINPRALSAERERQVCGKCHAYDGAMAGRVQMTPGGPWVAQTVGFGYPWMSELHVPYPSTFNPQTDIGNGNFVGGVHDLPSFFTNWAGRSNDDISFWNPDSAGGALISQTHRAQYTMLAQSAHAGSSTYPLACSDCHDPHSGALRPPSQVVQNGAGTDSYTFAAPPAVDGTWGGNPAQLYRNNVACLACHARGGPLAGVVTQLPDELQAITLDDVANVNIDDGTSGTGSLSDKGSATKNGVPIPVPSASVLAASKARIATAVQTHMRVRVGMAKLVVYDPTNDAMPVGRCVSCHMAKVGRSGGYATGLDNFGNLAVVEGDISSHVFSVIFPYTAPLGQAGPTYVSGAIGLFTSASSAQYDEFPSLPSGCGKCHPGGRRAMMLLPHATNLYPSYWPLVDHLNDKPATIPTSYTSKNAP